MLKFDLSRLENLRSKLFKIKINIGMTIKPENDIALVKETTSCKIRVSLGNSTVSYTHLTLPTIVRV